MRIQFTLKQKFDFCFVVLLILAVTVFAAVRYLGKNAEFFHLERNHRLLLSEIRADIAAVRFRSPVARIVSPETLLKKFDEALNILRSGQDELNAVEKALFKLGGFGRLFDTMDTSIAQTGVIHALLAKNLGREIDDIMIEEIETFLDIQYAESDQFVPLMFKAVTTTKLAVTALSILSITLVAWTGWVSRRSVLSPLQSAIHAAKQITSGDLRVSLATNQHDEMGDLMRALQKMTTSISGIVQEVRAGSVAIAGAAEQITVGHNNLSERTEHQASTLEQTAAGSEELAATVARNAQLSQEASDLTKKASNAAELSGEAVNKVIEMMSHIHDSAKQVTEIIGVIDHIAFQTNILALNAAVEAARAGEHGRGFAVVATEVRSLAQRSGTAAKEIRALIATSMERVAAGNSLAKKAGDAMQQSVEQARRSAELTREITDASDEQSAGIQQVSQAIMQLDHVAQQNAALVEEASAAAVALDTQARKLVELVDIFNTGEPHAAPTVKRAPPSSRAKERQVSTSKQIVRELQTSDEWSEF